MPVEYLSVEQETRNGRFAAEPTPGELEQFFRLDAKALDLARAKRRPATRPGWAVQWGTVRLLGTFLTEDPTAVPASVVAFAAEQLGEDPAVFAEYGSRQQTAYAALGNIGTAVIGENDHGRLAHCSTPLLGFGETPPDRPGCWLRSGRAGGVSD